LSIVPFERERDDVRTVFQAAGLLLAVIVPARNASAQAGRRPDTLTNASIIKMVVAKVPTDTVIRLVKTTPATFDVTATGLVSLTRANVPPEIMRWMMRAPHGSATPKRKARATR
jgi:hypothetical protein